MRPHTTCTFEGLASVVDVHISVGCCRRGLPAVYTIELSARLVVDSEERAAPNPCTVRVHHSDTEQSCHRRVYSVATVTCQDVAGE